MDTAPFLRRGVAGAVRPNRRHAGRLESAADDRGRRGGDALAAEFGVSERFATVRVSLYGLIKGGR